MPKSQYIISLILFLATLFNLYCKPRLADLDATAWFGRLVRDPVARSACPLRAVRCGGGDDDDATTCDCADYCSNAEDFVPFRVMPGDGIYVTDERLEPGTYCLPKGVGRCNLKTSRHVFSLSGWSCLGRNDVVFRGDKRKACRNEEARDPDENHLFDFAKNERPTEDPEDFYETLADGSPRYGCRCGSEALDGTRMVSAFPFVCSVDYCARDLPKTGAGSLGWRDGRCECGPYFNLDPGDPASPCRAQVTRLEGVRFVGRVDCMTRDSYERRALVCPGDVGGPVSFAVFATQSRDSNFMENGLHAFVDAVLGERKNVFEIV